MIEGIRHRVYEILEGTREEEDRLSQVVQGFIVLLILLNVAAVVLSTVKTLHDQYGDYFRAFEIFSVAVFTVEYVLRLWVSVEREGIDRPVRDRLRYMVTPGALIDLAAILPFYLPPFIGIDLRTLRMLRIFRLIRLMKLGRYSTSIGLLGRVVRKKKEQVGLALMAVLVVLVMASSLLYFVEREAQPEAFGSIPAAMWWGIVTLTTVGYGNIYPMTTLGKVLGGVVCLIGIGFFALPAGILASGFESALEDRHGEDEANGKDSALSRGVMRYCPHCGQRLAPGDQPAEAPQP